MDIIDAAHRIGHEYPGGAGALADRLGISRAVFNSKLNPNTLTHHLTLVESMRMQQLAERFDILFAMADACGFVCIPDTPGAPDRVEHGIAAMAKEFGDYMSRASDAIEDGKVTANELRRCEKELVELISAASALQSKLSCLAGSPAPLKKKGA